MRALKVLGLTLCLSGCIYAGEISLWPGRDDFIAGLSSYSIEYLDKDGPKLIKTETVTESDFAPNKMLTAYKGYSVADTKSYTRNYYTQESIVAPTDAVLVSGLKNMTLSAAPTSARWFMRWCPTPRGRTCFWSKTTGPCLTRSG